MTPTNTTQYDADTRQLSCSGEWDLPSLPALQALLDQTSWPAKGEINVEGHSVTKMDTAGAWLLNGWMDKQRKQGVNVIVKGFSEQHHSLITLIEKRMQDEQAQGEPVVQQVGFITRVGQSTTAHLAVLVEYLSFVGLLSLEALRLLGSPRRLRWGSLASVVYRTGYSALPIIALLSFMIGVVITYQMGLQLKNYGANIYIVDLLGLAILREFGPLLTAIMVAGRSG